jgi:viologen exporter family transport system permease protein
VGEAAAIARIYGRLVGARIRAQLQYRASFALNLIGAALISFLDFAAILVIFSQIDALDGWSVEEVALLYAVSSVSFAITDLVVGHLDLLPRMIRDGDFDLVLVRPLGSLFQVVSSDFALRRLGKALQGLAVLVVAIAALDVDWTLGRAAMVLLMIVTGVAIFGSVWVAFATVAFWFVDSTELANSFTYGGNFLSQYPVNVFGPWLRRFVVFVVPLAFVAYFPSLYVLDKPDPLGAPDVVQFLAPAVAVVSAVAARFIWKFAVRHYRSAGG